MHPSHETRQPRAGDAPCCDGCRTSSRPCQCGGTPALGGGAGFLGLDGRRVGGEVAIGARIDRPWGPTLRGVSDSPLASGPFGSQVSFPTSGPIGSSLERGWEAKETRSPGESPALGTEVERRYEVVSRPAIRAAAAAEAEARELPVGVRPASFGDSEVSLPFVGGDPRLIESLVDRLPMDGRARDDVVRRVRALRPVWWPSVLSGVGSAAIEERRDWVRAFVEAALLVPPDWIDMVLASLGGMEPSLWVGHLRTWVSYLVNLGPQWYADAREKLRESSPSEWLQVLRAFALEHPRMVQPPTLAMTVVSHPPTPRSPIGTQWVPPPPAPQRPCFVSGFDPSWGTPPETYRSIALRFDVDRGAYVFDEPYAIARSPRDSAGRYLFQRADFDMLSRQYRSGVYQLQPFKRPGSTSWEFRAIPATREVVCPLDLEPTSLTTPEGA